MNPQVQNYYSNYANTSEAYRKLKSLAIDMYRMYHMDIDETDLAASVKAIGTLDIKE